MPPSSATTPPREAGELPPKKIAWLHPIELLRTGYNVWLSTIAVEYIDRREMLAALQNIKIPDDGLPPAVLERGETIDAVYPPAQHHAGLWLDFVADIGDSWEATHAVATLLAARELRVQGHAEPLRPADIVVLGGDLVYPTPNRERYRRRTREPCMFAIPGNHDWYDGLTSFVREFCQGGHIGGWRMLQRRSYFAVKLTPGWWLWGIDIALDTRIDPPQQAFFLNVLKNRVGPEAFQPDDSIILCTAKPVWTEAVGQPTEAYRNLNHFVRNIVAKHDGHVRVIVAGDYHHYSRYENDAQDQLITAGGAGAYLTGTHHLPHRVGEMTDDLRSAKPASKIESHEYRVAPFPYPSRAESRRMALGALLLAFRPANWPFVFIVMGARYAILARNLINVITQYRRSIVLSSVAASARSPSRRRRVAHGGHCARGGRTRFGIVAALRVAAPHDRVGNSAWFPAGGAGGTRDRIRQGMVDPHAHSCGAAESCSTASWASGISGGGVVLRRGPHRRRHSRGDARRSVFRRV